nr:serine carboxypeptidase-like 46 [Tanacetum cinerariifolium]
IGNPLLDIDISVLAGDYLWAHGAISDKTLMLEKTVCNDSTYLRERDVQIALHANTTDLPYPWDFCVGPLAYQEQNLEIDVIPLISDLIKAGL